MRGKLCLVSCQYPLSDSRHDCINQSTDRPAKRRIASDVAGVAGAVRDLFQRVGGGGGRRKSRFRDAEFHHPGCVYSDKDACPIVSDAERPAHSMPQIATYVWRLLAGIDGDDSRQDVGYVVRVNDVVPDHLCGVGDDDRCREVGHSPKIRWCGRFQRVLGLSSSRADGEVVEFRFNLYRETLASQMSVVLLGSRYAALAVRYPTSVCLVGPFNAPTTPGS
jgi:hypothetical protein